MKLNEKNLKKYVYFTADMVNSYLKSLSGKELSYLVISPFRPLHLGSRLMAYTIGLCFLCVSYLCGI